MTVIEFFDKTPIENVISGFTVCPEKIVFLGDVSAIDRRLPKYERFFSGRGLSIEMVARTINKSSIEKCVETLAAIVEEEENCVFDLTGGEDIVLVAMGVVFERYRNVKNIQMHRFNIGSGKIIDCDSDGTVVQYEEPKISVCEQVLLHGGAVSSVTMDREELARCPAETLDAAWRLCKKDPSDWNTDIRRLKEILSYNVNDEDSLDVCIDLAVVAKEVGSYEGKIREAFSFLRRVQTAGLIRDLAKSETALIFACANRYARQLISNEGDVLETLTLQAVSGMKSKRALLIDDAARGVNIDWDGVLHDSPESDVDTVNEIDVMLMKGLTPVFISCKNGTFDNEELYKLNTVASRFGGSMAKKILVCTEFSFSEYLRQRAEDMNIHIIDRVHEDDFDVFCSKLKQAICQ